MSHRIREGTPADETALGVVFRRATLSNAGDRERLLAQPEYLEFEFPAGPRAMVRVAVDDEGRVLGFATLVQADGFFELEDLFVDPDEMRLGHGTALMRDAAEIARAGGVTRIEVTANPHATAFYESVGFVTVGEADTTFGPADRMHLAID